MSRVRASQNLNQYLFLDYMFLKGKLINERLSKKHFSVGITSSRKLQKFIMNPTRKLVCINDVKLSEKRYEKLRKAMLDAFEAKFPKKSKFEN